MARELSVEAKGFREVMLKAKQFEPALAKAIRKNLREAAKEVAVEVKDAARSAPVKGKQETGLREGIAAGVKVQIATGARKSGVFIVSSGSALPPGQKNLMRSFDNPKGWRHPLFGNDKKWVRQYGSPYFYKVIKGHEEQLRGAVYVALEEATRAIDRERP